jgi:hypothetical protein
MHLAMSGEDSSSLSAVAGLILEDHPILLRKAERCPTDGVCRYRVAITKDPIR